MAVIKCKMCGGDLALIEGQSVAECEYCGSRQTVPSADNEKKLNLFARANRLRAACEFDKAAGIYESIVADFPEEAEAYWGLVLCKYGIEYVDDPATGKKIPTCHRSSFESVMDDDNFDQAQENADALASRVYREEAKQIEEIRKGILEVSSNEQPYDIFICYKETDSSGDRTLDSVLAQDIYDALTAKGYRTFFARITLEDKLGQEYEPYIFAALNSAKIMLAVGTCYEHYNAVWVKNEWSRYLKLMTTDKSKHLIPCYKGLDAYDMPKEFARLQAQDLGKMGAIQDILRGVEKLLPRQMDAAVIPEKVIIGGAGGNNKIASLLDRGNMALEDGDWAKADSFFEDVLNNDSKNAQAYLGKTLAQEHCRTMDAFVRKRKGVYETVKGQKLELAPNTEHIEEMAYRCRIPNYLTAEEILNLYQFDLHYHSEVEERRQQYQKEQTYWENHKQLSRAEKFAAGAVAENLQREKKALFSALSDRVKQAEATQSENEKLVREEYARHTARMDARAAELHREALAQREQDYRNWVVEVKNTEDLETLRRAERFFANQGDYQKCPALAAHCQKRIADIIAENERLAAQARAAAQAEAERQRIAAEKAAALRKKRSQIITAALVLIIAAIIITVTVIIPAGKYKKAEDAVAAGNYQLAYDVVYPMDNSERRTALLEEIAREAVAAGNYQFAYDMVYPMEDSESRTALLKQIGQYGQYTVVKESDGYIDRAYEYNAQGFPERIVQTGEDPGVFEFTYEYDSNGSIISCTRNFLVDGVVDHCVTYEFFPGEAGIENTVVIMLDDPAFYHGKAMNNCQQLRGVRKITRMYNSGFRTSVVFDRNGLPVSYYDGDTEAQILWHTDNKGIICGWENLEYIGFESAEDVDYDEHGYMTEIECYYYDVTIRREYDAQGRIIRRTGTQDDSYSYVSYTYEYDALGNCVKMEQSNSVYSVTCIYEWAWVNRPGTK